MLPSIVEAYLTICRLQNFLVQSKELLQELLLIGKGILKPLMEEPYFWDEIGNMPYSMQILLLRVLQEKEL